MNEEEEDALSAGTPPPLVVGGFSLFEEDEQVAQRLQSLVPITRPQSRRMYLPLQLSWSEEQVMQQIGRAHRSNQVSAPMYMSLQTVVGGDRRFASTVAQSLQSMGNLTQDPPQIKTHTTRMVKNLREALSETQRQGNQSATGTALRAFALDGTYSGDGTYASPIIII